VLHFKIKKLMLLTSLLPPSCYFFLPTSHFNLISCVLRVLFPYGS
jgi:hypothetical protein